MKNALCSKNTVSINYVSDGDCMFELKGNVDKISGVINWIDAPTALKGECDVCGNDYYLDLGISTLCDNGDIVHQCCDCVCNAINSEFDVFEDLQHELDTCDG